MIEQIIRAIALILHKAFKDITIYTENVPQGFCEPSFFIRLLNAKQKPLLGSRFSHEYLFDIHYFPKSEYRGNEEMNEVALKLYEHLEYVPYENRHLKGRDMHHEQQYEALHFFITFEETGCSDKEGIPNMEDLIIIEKVKRYGNKK